MDLLHGLIVITSIHFLAAASPGPDFVLVTQQTLAKGRRMGLLCSLGIALGLSVHILYSSFGLAALIANSAVGLWVIKILGGSYLLYLGYKGLRAKPQSATTSAAPIIESSSYLKTIGAGFWCNVLNPKAPIYFVSLFTVVLSPDMPLYQLAIYGAWIMLIQFIWFALVVVVLSRPAINEKFQRMGHWVDRVFGGAMVLLGLKVLTTKVS
ncbi:LysE family translocator [Marinomonas ostreistagni]|uniref:LysE family translocator n=1 Tax=Marinomonas ostreistagni TaxID=359209 RepID=UPI00195133A4|nr:LysE family transporter [Marinomonas ostreistagni]MBM6549890.1 LysE family transporter [Marinomonas ostreistagni]